MPIRTTDAINPRSATLFGRAVVLAGTTLSVSAMLACGGPAHTDRDVPTTTSSAPASAATPAATPAATDDKADAPAPEPNGADAPVQTGPAPPTLDERPLRVPIPELACKPVLRRGRVVVDGERTPIRPAHEFGYGNDEDALDEFAHDWSLRTWPIDDESVAVALSYWVLRSYNMVSPELDGRLWRVPCDDPMAADLLANDPGADFGEGLMIEPRRLLYSGKGGAGVIDLTTGEKRSLLAPLRVPDCRGSDRLTLDVVDGLAADGSRVLIDRGAQCGSHGDWEPAHYEVELWPLPDAPLPIDDPRIRRARVPTALALDADGTLWLGDGVGCGPKQTYGGLFRSDDEGDSWTAVPIGWGGIAQVVVDAEEDGALAVRTEHCNAGEGRLGGVVFYTRNDGERWVPMPLDDVPFRNDDPQATQLVLEDGDISHAMVEVDEAWFETSNAGTTWTKMTEGPTPTAPDLIHEGVRYALDQGRLVRTELDTGDAETLDLTARLHVAAARARLSDWVGTPVLTELLEVGYRVVPPIHLEVRCSTCRGKLESRDVVLQPDDETFADDNETADPFRYASLPATWACDDRCCDAVFESPPTADVPELYLTRFCAAHSVYGTTVDALRFEER